LWVRSDKTHSEHNESAFGLSDNTRARTEAHSAPLKKIRSGLFVRCSVPLEHPALEQFMTVFVGVCHGGDGRTKYVVAAGAEELGEIRKLLHVGD
jgi:hypothetical protein